MDLPNLRSSGARKMSARHKDEVVRLVTAGSPQEIHLWRSAVEGQPQGRDARLPPGGLGDLGGGSNEGL
jgi:hypothetical protein